MVIVFVPRRFLSRIDREEENTCTESGKCGRELIPLMDRTHFLRLFQVRQGGKVSPPLTKGNAHHSKDVLAVCSPSHRSLLVSLA